MTDSDYEKFSRVIEGRDGRRWDCQFASAGETMNTMVVFACRPEGVPQASPKYITVPRAAALDDPELARLLAPITP